MRLTNEKLKFSIAHFYFTNALRMRNLVVIFKLFFKVLKNPRNSTIQIVRNATFVGDGIISSHDTSILDRARPAFENAIAGLPSLVASTYSAIQWRAQICTWAAWQVESVEGDFVDCGVWYGVLPKTVCEYIDIESTERTYFLVDSWGSDSLVQNRGKYSDDIYKIVQNRFSKYSNVELVRGLVPDVLAQIPTKKVAFLALDMNGFKAEIQALEHFYPILSKGAVVYLDDYGWNFPELREGVKNFLRDKMEELLVFPTGNAIFIKK
jgi:O-methyltransferase